MLAFVQSLPNVFQKIVNHLETPAITDLLLTLIRMEEVLPEESSSIEWLNEQGLLDKLISKLDPTLDADVSFGFGMTKVCNMLISLLAIIGTFHSTTSDLRNNTNVANQHP